MENLRCVVERITYHNEENGYSVLKCRVRGFSDLVTVVGNMAEVHVGSVLSADGDWKVDSKYGRQFSFVKCEETMPATAYGIEKYLGSGLIKGIGPVYAKKIVKKFGKDTLEVIENYPDRLLEVDGIGNIRVERIKKSWDEQKEIRNIMLFLQGHDVSTSHASKIFKTYGKDSIKVVTENPYRMADDIWGIGFKTADTIAAKLGFEHDAYPRLRSGIKYTLNVLSEDGHCFATEEQLMESASELLGAEREKLSEALGTMVGTRDVIRDEDAIYLPPFFYSENGVARRLRAIKKAKPSITVDTSGLRQKICSLTGVAYDEVQLEAIETAVGSKVFVLTGGPGTGKTTTTLGIITAFRSAGAKILLAAPTGRAAKRLSETTHMEAKTIHRLLEVKPPEGYKKNESNPLKGDVLILDECSMIDVMLMYNLPKAVPDKMTVIFVGDVDQLPSVGAGNVLRDIIESGVVPVVRLTKIFRQAQTSRIITSAHKVNRGEIPYLRTEKNSDFFFISEEDPEKAAGMIVNLVKTRLPKYFKTTPQNIQVLTPMQRGNVGAANLNQLLQSAVNPGGIGITRGGFTFRSGDRVMQIRNNYDKEVFNGDIGIVERIDFEDRVLHVSFDGRRVEYDYTELDEIVLAYATTIHKSQGSEYPVVVMPVMTQHYAMLQRNLIYTGITRAKKGLVIVGTVKALAMAVKKMPALKRNTKLSERLKNGPAALSPADGPASDQIYLD